MKLREKLESIKLRQKGYSLNEIVSKVGVSKSTASVWVRDVVLTKSAQKKLHSKISNGQIASRNAIRAKTLMKEKEAISKANLILLNADVDKNIAKIICAMIYYCEGVKDVKYGIYFTNSDPLMVSTFLRLFRLCFEVSEKKFRVCIHLHSYHKVRKQLSFWSKVTNIPLRQFIKPYMKQSSKSYKKDEYQGCASIRYSDANIGREMKEIAVQFMKEGPIG